MNTAFRIKLLALCVVAYGCRHRVIDTNLSAISTVVEPGIAKFYTGILNVPLDLLDFDGGKQVRYFDLIAGTKQIGTTGSLEATSLRSCRSMEVVAGVTPTFAAGTECRVEFVGTGRLSTDRNGIAMALIPLANQSGMTKWTAKVSALDPASPVQKISGGPAKAANLLMDEDAIVAAMKATVAKFGTLSSRIDCLNNPRTGRWTDIQAHYYCQFPYEIRYCFSTILAESRNPEMALNYCRDSGNAPDWQNRFDRMFWSIGPGAPAWTWLAANQLDAFIYVMFSVSGVADFNLESQNRAINRFYLETSMPRPRRAVDPYPAWLPEQPRYDEIRTAQMSSATAVSSAAPAIAPVVPPISTRSSSIPTPQPPSIANQNVNAIKAGHYAEIANLEGAACDLDVDNIVDDGNGDGSATVSGLAATCVVESQPMRQDLKSAIICKGGRCIYKVFLGTDSDFERPVEIGGNGDIAIKGNRRAYSWHLIP